MKCIHAIILFLTIYFASYSLAIECELDNKNSPQVAYSITVDPSGKGNFTTIQDAIDYIPLQNTKWVRISISPGQYREKVSIPPEKPCIFLEGAGSKLTSIEWNDHGETDKSATFSSFPDNILVKSVAFKNTYNMPRGNAPIVPAVAARIYGDKSGFYDCAFHGVQDTLWDSTGRHYYKNCYIEGGIDFIWGYAQSLYEGCTIYANIGKYDEARPCGTITAQGRSNASDTGGFVFKNCEFTGYGQGKTLLGRAYGPYSRVIIYESNINDVVEPLGWDAWGKPINTIEYVEDKNQGMGADTSKRVSWAKNLSNGEIEKFVDISYVDKEGWIAKLSQL